MSLNENHKSPVSSQTELWVESLSYYKIKKTEPVFSWSSRCFSLMTTTGIQCKCRKACTISSNTHKYEVSDSPQTNLKMAAFLWMLLLEIEQTSMPWASQCSCTIPWILLGQDERLCSQISQKVQVWRLPFHQCRCCSQAERRSRGTTASHLHAWKRIWGSDSI